MDPVIIFFLVCLSILVIFLAIFIPVKIVKTKYTNFVYQHSVGLKKLLVINKEYSFHKIPNLDMSHSYDNENMYGDISCLDYLTYQLVYKQKEVSSALKKTLENKSKFDAYLKEIKESCPYNEWDTTELLKNKARLARYERIEMEGAKRRPVVSFGIWVSLDLTNINGVRRRTKTDHFNAEEIKNVINRLNQKRGSYYVNQDIWQSICRVERGKVTNRLRFAVYARDGYRCRYCGRKTDDLEVDHIRPISKGGKSTLDNLQTLCHRCNVKKGSNIE